jgi:hypothetical protein
LHSPFCGDKPGFFLISLYLMAIVAQGRETCTINDPIIHAAGLRVAHNASDSWTEPSAAAHALPISRPEIKATAVRVSPV